MSNNVLSVDLDDDIEDIVFYHNGLAFLFESYEMLPIQPGHYIKLKPISITEADEIIDNRNCSLRDE